MSDSGLWFVNGKVTTKEEHDRVWRVWNKKWDRIYLKQTAEKERHRKMMEKLEAEFKALKQPYTPWVGHVSEGGVTEFVDSARAEWRRRKKANETTDY